MIQQKELENWSEEAKLAYAAALIETDGWVGLTSIFRKDTNAQRITPLLGLTNQNIELLHRISIILEIPFHITTNGRPGRDSRGIRSKLTTYQVKWNSPLHLIPALEKILPYMTVKRARGLAVLEYCKGRITQEGKVHRRSKNYSPRDFELVAFCKDSYIVNTTEGFR